VTGYFKIATAMGIAPRVQDDAPAIDPAFCRQIGATLDEKRG
jgi:hypothetical protein